MADSICKPEDSEQMTDDRKHNQPVSLPCPAEMLLPHRSPMLFIDSLVNRVGDKATAVVTVTANSICLDPERGILPEFFIEIMAQTMAAANGYDALCENKAPRNGFLVGLDKYQLLEKTAGAILRIEIAKTFEFGPVKIIEGQVFCDDRVLAIGEVKVWEDLEHDGDR
jgi:3-hydroxyacyl-[acyl-carrier-protein] dehydratase